MPTWLIITTGVLGGVVTLSAIWNKVLRPLALAISAVERAVPVMKVLTDTFGEDATTIRVLKDIAAEFRTDSGQSLRDLANRLEDSANENKSAVNLLQVRLESMKEMAVRDREHLAHLTQTLDRMRQQLEQVITTVKRVEERQVHPPGGDG